MASGLHVLVCGLGQSGTAAARLLRSEGHAVVAVDERLPPQADGLRDTLTALGCTVQFEAVLPPEGDYDLVVTSPGLDVNGPFLSELRRRGIPFISELELGWSRFKGRTVAVTGSNGKSSVVKALADCFTVAGLCAIPCGNYGLPVCQAVLDSPAAEWLVIEVSSFQLETCVAFRPDIGVLLNILPNHLDRHGTMDTYAGLKARLFACQREGDVALTPSDWRARLSGRDRGAGRWMTFGVETGADFHYEPGQLIEKDGVCISVSGSYFDNEVLGANAAALLGAALAADLHADSIQRAVCDFEPLPHRAQPIGEREGVLYVDDSKATNLSAMMASIRMQPHPVWLIAGGRPKESDFSVAIPLLKDRVKGALLIGEAASAMAAAWSPAIPCTVCETLECAVEQAREWAAAPDVVLLAPACTSYDQFTSYVQRGEAFRKMVSKKG